MRCSCDLQSVKARYETGDFTAGNMLHDYYRDGYYVKKNQEKAESIMIELASRGNLNSIGECYASGYGQYDKSDERAVEYYQKGVESCDAMAMINLSFCYRFGIAIGKDEKKSTGLLHQSLALGCTPAFHYAAFCHRDGITVKKDLTKAAALFTAAASEGWPPAIRELGVLYATGRGVQKDISLAVLLFKQAADIGVEEAVDDLFKLGIQYTPSKKVDEGEVEECGDSHLEGRLRQIHVRKEEEIDEARRGRREDGDKELSDMREQVEEMKKKLDTALVLPDFTKMRDVDELETLERKGEEMMKLIRREKERRNRIEREERENEKKCKVCLDNEKTVLLLPCAHLCLCQECSSQLSLCPICKSDISERKHVYDV
uniref:RING-type domain-containing protein n=1 Tax=Palpitomonas bilix TaxID=652834 RepID=A0A7S3DED6_9EUKA|mmetsp:Transcript_33835/g.86830  ORF Transcript_33835/g.86830 Transcript_33835/m.86830 type:complete len:374 (+) Transcript_33835:155-1276(+)